MSRDRISCLEIPQIDYPKRRASFSDLSFLRSYLSPPLTSSRAERSTTSTQTPPSRQRWEEGGMGVDVGGEIGNMKLDSGWLAARSSEVPLTGVQLTTTHPPTGPTDAWMEAAVPGTVLGTLLKNSKVPDPFYGLENEAIIDIADSGREHYTFWFFNSFRFTLSGGNRHRLDLKFRAINYSADLYLNGHKKILPKGMFRRHSLDITDILHPDGGDNLVALLVHPPDHPGTIPPEGGQGGDHEIGKDVAAQYVEGWDWMTPIRDRNTGIWDEVSISITGPVKIIDPHLVSTFFDDYTRVYLHATVFLQNASSWIAECSLSVQVTTEVEGNVCLVEHLSAQDLKIPPKTGVEHTFSPMFFYKPKLWWPNGMGKQSLYHVTIAVDVKGFGESDSWSHQFGFRKIESSIDEVTGGRLFKVNGEPIFIRGGSWILSDGLLRLSRKRYQTDVKFHADMNFNMIRCWGGGLAERPEFYHYCDIYGLLVWQEFWITGDVDGRGEPVSNPDGPLDHELFMLCARDTVKLLRNHASLALWVGGNEQTPPDDINKALVRDLKLHPLFKSDGLVGRRSMQDEDPGDPSQYLDGTRAYVQGSLWDGFGDGKGNFCDGPYEIQNPEDFFKEDFCSFGFNPEVGSVGMPVAATIRATMPQQGWHIPILKQTVDGDGTEEVPNPIWDYHKYIPYSKPGKVSNQIAMYGKSTALDDFCEKAQLVNYVQYRALLEGWTSRMWTKYTGVLIWKTQNPWTGLRGQFYDHLLDQTAGFYGCRCAAEPIHVQLNLASYFIEVVNTTSRKISDVSVEISVWDTDGQCPFYKVTDAFTASPKNVTPVFEFKYQKSKNVKPVYFLLLKLFTRSDTNVLSRNFYWLHQSGGDYTLLEQYRKRKIPLEITTRARIAGSSYVLQMQIKNSSTNSDSTSPIQTTPGIDGNEYGAAEVIPKNQEVGLLRRFCGKFLHTESADGSGKVVRTNGGDRGVAFFLRFSVHSAKKTHDEAEDTRILPVHYSDNYFSLVPGESTKISMEFEAPEGTTPRVAFHGWNYAEGHQVF